MDSNESQSEKPVTMYGLPDGTSMDLQVLGTTNVLRAEQWANIALPTLSKPSHRVTAVKEEQLANAISDSLTEAGIVIDSSAEHPKNALFII